MIIFAQVRERNSPGWLDLTPRISSSSFLRVVFSLEELLRVGSRDGFACWRLGGVIRAEACLLVCLVVFSRIGGGQE